MVDFMGRSPEDSDLAGIKILLQQLFLNSTVDLRALAEHIISRNYVGSVVKQALDDVEEEDDDEDSDVNDVFGITSVVNISKGQVNYFYTYYKLCPTCFYALKTFKDEFINFFRTKNVSSNYGNY